MIAGSALLALAGVHQPMAAAPLPLPTMAAAQTPAKKMAGGLAALLPTIGGGLPLPTQLAAGDAYNWRPAMPITGGESWLLKI